MSSSRGVNSRLPPSAAASTSSTGPSTLARTGTRQFLESLEPLNIDEAVGLYHASPRDPIWEYVLSPLQAELCLDAQERRVCLIGHSHVALSFSRDGGAAATGQTRAADEELT